jgi:hypothetical protein
MLAGPGFKILPMHTPGLQVEEVLVARRGAEREARRTESRQSKGGSDKQIAKLKETIAKLKKEHSEKHAKSEAKHMAAMKGQDAKYKAELKKLRDGHKAKRDAAISKQRESMSKLKQAKHAKREARETAKKSGKIAKGDASLKRKADEIVSVSPSGEIAEATAKRQGATSDAVDAEDLDTTVGPAVEPTDF